MIYTEKFRFKLFNGTSFWSSLHPHPLWVIPYILGIKLHFKWSSLKEGNVRFTMVAFDGLRMIWKGIVMDQWIKDLLDNSLPFHIYLHLNYLDKNQVKKYISFMFVFHSPHCVMFYFQNKSSVTIVRSQWNGCFQLYVKTHHGVGFKWSIFKMKNKL